MSNDNKLKERAVLVGLNISCWQGTRIDLGASDKTIKSYDASTNAGSFTKKLFPGSDRLKEISNMAGHMREWFRTVSLPWTDGFRVIPSSRVFDISKLYQDQKSEFETLVTDFCSNYVDEKHDAKIKLGRLYNEDDYPLPDLIRAQFSTEMNVLPVPDSSDFRTEIPKELVEEMSKRAREAEQDALKTNLRQVRDKVSTALGKLKSVDNPIFRDSLIQNVIDELHQAQVRDFDGSSVDILNDMGRAVERLSPDSIRSSEASKAEAVEKLSDIDQRLKELLGE